MQTTPHNGEKEIATHLSILAWRIPGTEEPWWAAVYGSHRVEHDWSNLVAAAAYLRMRKYGNLNTFFLIIIVKIIFLIKWKVWREIWTIGRKSREEIWNRNSFVWNEILWKETGVKDLCVCFINSIGMKFIYNVVLVSGVSKVIRLYVNIPLFVGFFSHIDYHRMLGEGL